MKIETKYAIASSVNIGAEYDKGVKKLFKSKEIIVPIMEMVIPEFEGCSQEEILNCLDLASITSDEVVSDAPVSETDEYRIRDEDAGIFVRIGLCVGKCKGNSRAENENQSEQQACRAFKDVAFCHCFTSCVLFVLISSKY